jgi:hypothetical protein
MAYTWKDVLQLAGNLAPRMVSEGSGPLLCDLAQSMIWNEADWRGSLAAITPFYLVAGVGSYDNAHADFLGLRLVQIVDLSSNPDFYYPPLEIRTHLPRTTNEGMPEIVSYYPVSNAFRLYPTPPTNMAAEQLQILGQYKKRCTAITAANINSQAIPFDDTYLEVCVEALRYQLLMASGDRNAAGSVVIMRNTPQYTGQLGVAMAAIERMKAAEGINLGPPLAYAPQYGLV